MTDRFRIALAPAIVIALLALTPSSALADACTDLVSVKLDDAKVDAATAIPAGPFTTPAQLAIPPENFTVPAFCRVQLTTRKRAKTEVWLPAAWNQKMAGLGNGGELGAVVFDELYYAILEGYAGVSTDLGHQSYGADASWALNRPDLIKEFGYRATHDMTVAAKALVSAYYGRAPAHTYFYGGSAGGRQALMEAERFPTDYDGIVSLYPALGWTHIASGMIAQELKLGAAGAQLSADQSLALNAAVLAACDDLDRLHDGIIADPTRCVFDPGTLACAPSKPQAACLSAEQVAAVRALYQPFRLSSGALVYGGLPYGSEYEWSCSVLHEAFNFPFANSWFQNEVFSNPNWDFHTFDPDADVARADALLAGTLDASSPNLDAFRAAGGKLLMAQGQSDAIVVPQNTTDYYAKLLKRYGKGTKLFVRLFMEPGVGHCGAGPGPGAWDPLVTLSSWTEGGTAPDKIVAYKSNSDGSTMSRPLCPYPKQARYIGQGSTNDAANFYCAVPHGRHRP